MSQDSFGAKIDRAKQIEVHLSTFPRYRSTGEQSVAGYGAYLNSLELLNVDAATKIESYSTAKDLRRRSFNEDIDSLIATAGMILAACCSIYELDSRQASVVRTMVRKINGRTKKKGKPPPEEKDPEKLSADEIPKSISKREAGFGNKLKTLADIVATVKNFGASYVPDNPDLEVIPLEAKLIVLSEINKNVTVTYSALRQVQIERKKQSEKLTNLVQRIKKNVSSQFGVKSVEYGLIKGIKV